MTTESKEQMEETTRAEQPEAAAAPDAAETPVEAGGPIVWADKMLEDLAERVTKRLSGAGTAAGGGEASNGAASPDLSEIVSKLNRIEERLDTIGAAPSPDGSEASETAAAGAKQLRDLCLQIQEDISHQVDSGLGKVLQRLEVSQTDAEQAREDRQRFQSDALQSLRELQETLAQSEDDAEAESASSRQWESVILAGDLFDSESLAADRRKLIDDILAGDAAARMLAGQLMMAESAGSEQMAQLLKDVGEAFYGWRPKTSDVEDRMEVALCDWLTNRLETVGLRNTLELVRPGDRFDNSRHNASERGVEVSEVRGWVVLRDNGRVYTKANVSVR